MNIKHKDTKKYEGQRYFIVSYHINHRRLHRCFQLNFSVDNEKSVSISLLPGRRHIFNIFNNCNNPQQSTKCCLSTELVVIYYWFIYGGQSFIDFNLFVFQMFIVIRAVHVWLRGRSEVWSLKYQEKASQCSQGKPAGRSN